MNPTSRFPNATRGLFMLLILLVVLVMTISAVTTTFLIEPRFFDDCGMIDQHGSKLGNKTIEVRRDKLLVMAQSSKISERMEAAYSLSSLPDRDEAESLSLKLLQDTSPLVRKSTIMGLIRLGPLQVSTLRAVVHSIANEDDPDNMTLISHLFGVSKSTARPVVPDLIKIIREPDYQHKATACWCLAKIGPEAREALPELREAQQSKSPSVRRAASQAILYISDKASDFIRH